MHLGEIRQPRRTVVAGAGLGLAATALAACSTYGKESAAAEQSDPPASTSGSGSAATPEAANVLAKTADVPVGSGVIVDDVVLTQPTAGTFKGLSATCTHAGCTLSSVDGGTINCACHGSKFNLDGSVAHGPATSPLEPKAISVQGDSIVAG